MNSTWHYYLNRIVEIGALIAILISLNGCRADDVGQKDVLNDSLSQSVGASIIDIISLPETSLYNPYEQSHVWSRNTSKHDKRDTPFMLHEDQRNYDQYQALTSHPGFVLLLKEIRQDSAQLARDYQSALFLLANPHPFNAFSDPFVAIMFFGDSSGILYSALLDSSSVQKKQASTTIIRLVKTIALLRPQSQEQIGLDGGYLTFISTIVNGQSQSFVARRAIPYHVYDHSRFPEMSPERFRVWKLTDSLIWGIVQMVDSTARY